MANILNEPLSDFPETIRAGDTVKVKRSDIGTDYPNSTYTAKFEARCFDHKVDTITITATADNSDYLFTFTSTATANYHVGEWAFIVTVTDGTNRVTVDEGTFKVLQDIPTDSSTDTRSHARIVLDKIETLLEGKADADVQNYSINNRSLTKMSVDELLKWRDYYKAEVLREKRIERAKSGQGSGNRVLVSF
jgi:hypothetical protein